MVVKLLGRESMKGPVPMRKAEIGGSLLPCLAIDLVLGGDIGCMSIDGLLSEAKQGVRAEVTARMVMERLTS